MELFFQYITFAVTYFDIIELNKLGHATCPLKMFAMVGD